jgi:hypothetical protein
MGTTMPGAAMADLARARACRRCWSSSTASARRPSGEPLTPLLRPRVRLGFAKICRVRVSS